jgi:CHAD domain-containing protein
MSNQITYPTGLDLRLQVPAGAMAEAADALRRLGGEPVETPVRITWFDTPAEDFAAAGLCLRLCDDGRQRVQQLRRHAAEATREWEWPVKGEGVDLGLLAYVATGLTADTIRATQPAFSADLRRGVTRISGGDAVLEAVLDDGALHAGAATRAVHDLRLSLLEGPPAALFRTALQVHAAVPLQLGLAPKAIRGVALRHGRGPVVTKPPRPPLPPGIDAPGGLRMIAAAAMTALTANRAAAIAGDPEGLHQMRIALRRLRVSLVLFAPLLEGPALDPYVAELRRLGRVLGAARDWDVFCLETLPAALPEPPPALAEAAADRRAAAHGALREELHGPALTSLVLGLSEWLERVPPGASAGRPLRKLAPDLLDRLARKPARRGRHIRRRSTAELHGLRKSLKKLRYGVEALASLFPRKKVRRTLKHCKALQHCLGEISDAAVAVAFARALVTERPELASALEGVTHAATARHTHALVELRDAWDDFRDADAFWR